MQLVHTVWSQKLPCVWSLSFASLHPTCREMRTRSRRVLVPDSEPFAVIMQVGSWKRSSLFRSGYTFFTNLTALWQKGMCDWQRDIAESEPALLTQSPLSSEVHSMLRNASYTPLDMSHLVTDPKAPTVPCRAALYGHCSCESRKSIRKGPFSSQFESRQLYTALDALRPPA